MLALSAMDATLQGIFFLVTVGFFVIAGYIWRASLPALLACLGGACFAFVFMWNAFASA